jgi:hypothetical protein
MNEHEAQTGYVLTRDDEPGIEDSDNQNPWCDSYSAVNTSG